MRADYGFHRCNCSETASATTPGSLLFLYGNPYGLYVSPGGCPLISCHSMSRSVHIQDCSGNSSIVINLKQVKKTAEYKIGPLVRGVTIDKQTGAVYAAWTCGVTVLPINF